MLSLWIPRGQLSLSFAFACVSSCPDSDSYLRLALPACSFTLAVLVWFWNLMKNVHNLTDLSLPIQYSSQLNFLDWLRLTLCLLDPLLNSSSWRASPWGSPRPYSCHRPSRSSDSLLYWAAPRHEQLYHFHLLSHWRLIFGAVICARFQLSHLLDLPVLSSSSIHNCATYGQNY